MQDVVVPGSKWRRAAFYWFLFSVTFQVLDLLRGRRFDPIVIIAVGVGVTIVALLESSERYRLDIREGIISGPPRRGLRRRSIPLREIDLQRSAKPNWFGGWTLWSRHGEAIYIDPITIPRRGRLRILEAVGLAK